MSKAPYDAVTASLPLYVGFPLCNSRMKCLIVKTLPPPGFVTRQDSVQDDFRSRVLCASDNERPRRSRSSAGRRWERLSSCFCAVDCSMDRSKFPRGGCGFSWRRVYIYPRRLRRAVGERDRRPRFCCFFLWLRWGSEQMKKPDWFFLFFFFWFFSRGCQSESKIVCEKSTFIVFCCFFSWITESHWSHWSVSEPKDGGKRGRSAVFSTVFCDYTLIISCLFVGLFFIVIFCNGCR